MHRHTVLRVHFCTVLSGVIISVLAAAYFYFFKEMELKDSTAVLAVVNIPFLIIGSIILFRMRGSLVVPKYPREKTLNKKIKRYPYIDLGFALLAVLYFIHNLVF